MAFGDTFKFTIDIDDFNKRVVAAEKRFSDMNQHVDKMVDDALQQREKKVLDMEGKRARVLRNILQVGEESVKLASKEVDLYEKKYEVTKRIHHDEHEASRQRETHMARIGAGIGRVAQSLQQAQFAGFTNSSMMRTAGSALGMIPVAGPLFDIAANLFANELQASEDQGQQRYRMFQHGGEGAYQTLLAAHSAGDNTGLLGLAEDPDGLRGKLIAMGLGPNEVAKIVGGSAQAGVSTAQSLMPLAGLQSGFGIDGNPLMGSMRRSGAMDPRNQNEALGAALAVAFSTGLEKARIPEAFTNLARAADSVISGSFSLQNAVAEQAFVGKLGPAFQGATGAAAAAESTLDAMSHGGGGALGNVFALQAGGLGGGTGYATAVANMQQGIKGGGMTTQDILSRYAKVPIVQKAWGPGTKPGRSADKDTAWMIVTQRQVDVGVFVSIMDGFFYRGGAAGSGLGDFGKSILSTLGMGGFTDKAGHDILNAQKKAFGDRAPRTGEEGGIFDESGDPTGGMFSMASGAVSSVMDAFTPSAAATPGISAFVSAHAMPGESANLNYHQSRGYEPGGHHDSIDIGAAPGSPVTLPWKAKVVFMGSTGTPHDRSLPEATVAKYGFSMKLARVDNGDILQANHLFPDPRGRFSVGQVLPAGTVLGHTSTEKLFPGGSQTHLDASYERGGKRINPLSVPGIEGIMGGTSGTSASPAAGGSPSGAAGHAGGASGAIHVFVHDARTSVHAIGSAFKAGGHLFGSG